jgi:hypothetical protein
MKTIYTLSTLILIALSLNSFADDKLKNKDKSSAVSVAPFIWGDNENEVPAELVTLKTKNVFVPVAPFVWGRPEDSVSIEENEKLVVPVAPFIYGDADSDAPAELANIKAVNLEVPVAPFVLGSPDADIPSDLITTL